MYLKDIYESTTDEAVASAARRLRTCQGNDNDATLVADWVRGEVEKDKQMQPSVLKGRAREMLVALALPHWPDERYGVSLTYVRTDVLGCAEIGEPQKFSTKQILDRLADGLVVAAGNEFVWKTTPELRFRIVRRPGYCCCFDDEPMADRNAASAYVAAHYTGQPSPDANNPAGFRRDNFYYCVRVS